MLTPRREAFPTAETIFVETQTINGRELDDLGQARFTAFWLTDQGWVPGGVRGQCFHTDLAAWITRTERQGGTVVRAFPCSYPGCGQPTAFLPHRDGTPGAGWRHLDDRHETLTHVGYPMDRSSSWNDKIRGEFRSRMAEG
jgi:hypothetical protein